MKVLVEWNRKDGTANVNCINLTELIKTHHIRPAPVPVGKVERKI